MLPGGPSDGLTASGSTTLPSLSTSRTTTAWMGAASTFSRRATSMSAVALRPGRREAGGSFRVILTLKSLAWLAVLPVAVVWPAVCEVPRTTAEEPISVTSPLILRPSRASTRTSAGWPSFRLRMSVSSTMISHSITERSATVMITVGLKLWAPITTSPSSLGRLVTTPSMGEITVVLRRSSRVLSSWAWSWAMRRRCDSTAAWLHLEVGLGLVEGLVGDQPLLVHLLGALEGQARRRPCRPAARSSSALAPCTAASDWRFPAS